MLDVSAVLVCPMITVGLVECFSHSRPLTDMVCLFVCLLLLLLLFVVVVVVCVCFTGEFYWGVSHGSFSQEFRLHLQF